MKVIASRVGIGADKADIRFLIRWLGFTRSEEIFAVVCRYYPSSLVLPRSMYLIEEILAEEGFE